MFAGEIRQIPAKDLRDGLKDVPHFEIAPNTLLNILVDTKICSSKREANEFIKNGAISVNGEIVKDAQLQIDENLAIDGDIVVIRRGKKKYYFCSLKKEN